jgi:hypothetical protein
VPYSSALVATGGVPPYTFSIVSGSLPPGLTLNPSTGAITGTPTTAGTYNYTARVTDSTGAHVDAACSITVAPPQLTLSCASGSAQVGVPYSSALVATGGVPPYTFSIVSGSLPPGLTLNPSTGAITGTPTTAGIYSYTARVTDSTGAHVDAACSITVAPARLTLSCASGTAEVALPYSSAFVASGGVPPYTFSIVSGSLPPGLTLNPSTGALTGTPSSEGTFSFTVQVQDSQGNVATAGCSITVTTCGTSLSPIDNDTDFHEMGTQGEVIWFNSHLQKLQGTIPSSDFQLHITGGQVLFGTYTLDVPDAVIYYSSTATCSSTLFNTAFNRFETTLPLSAASSEDETLAAALAWLVPPDFPQNINSVSWHADISSTAPGVQATWQFGSSNWLTSHGSDMLPGWDGTSFSPDYNGMEVKPSHSTPTCDPNYVSGDHAGAPEFSDRSQLLTGGGSGGGGSNWTGSFSATPPPVTVCSPTLSPDQAGSCFAAPINQSIQLGANFAAIGLEGSNLQLSGPLQISGNLGIGSGLFNLSGGGTLNGALYADPSANVQIESGSSLAGGTVKRSMSPLQIAATNLSDSMAALSPTQTFSKITSAVTIKGNGGQNVVSIIGAVHLSGGDNLTISGGASDTFIFNVPSGLQLENGSSIVLKGVPPNHVLFNFPTGSTGMVQTNVHANTKGIFLAPYLRMQINGGVHNSEFITGGQLSFQSNPVVKAPQCSK